MRFLWFLLILSAFSVSACGGGGSPEKSSTPTKNNAVYVSNANPDQHTKVGTAFSYDATQQQRTFVDVDGDYLTYTVAYTPDHGDFSASNGVITGMASAPGDVEVSVTASDGLTSATDKFMISVDPGPADVELSAPNSDQLASLGEAFSYDAAQGGTTFTDEDGDELTYSVSFSPANSGLSAAASVISGMPAAAGTVTVTITATDGNSSASDSFDIVVTLGESAVEREFGNKIDMENLADYENFGAPAYFGSAGPNVVTYPVTDAGATLGRVLFYDRALSIDDTVSCASCHQQDHAFGDPDIVSSGVAGGRTVRHATRLVNTIFSDDTNFFWDERAPNLETQILGPLQNQDEHGFSGQGGRPDLAALISKLQALDYYQELFTFVYGDNQVTEARIQSALSQFVNSIVSFDSRFDAGRAQVTDIFTPFPNFTFDENEGKNIYMSGPQDDGAGCRRCHADPTFSIFPDSGHIGVIGVAGDANATDLTNTRSPSLRDVFKPNGQPNGPFMHDGSMTTMRDVLNHYATIPVPETEPLRTEFLATIDSQLINAATGEVERLVMSNAEMDQVEAFLKTLTGSNIYTDPKWSDPFE